MAKLDSAKTTGVGTEGRETLLAADVSLEASAVGKGCTEGKLKEFQVGSQINRHGRSDQGGGQPVAGGGCQERPYLPPRHPGRAPSNQQMMGQPSPIQLSQFYSALAALGGGMGPTTH